MLQFWRLSGGECADEHNDLSIEIRIGRSSEEGGRGEADITVGGGAETNKNNEPTTALFGF